MKRAIIMGIIISTGFAGVALGGDNPIADRKAIMKNTGAAADAGGAMLKGEVEFNLAAAQLILRTMNSTAHAVTYLFPEGSETGMETTAAPSIWSDPAGFQAIADKMAADSSAKVTDMDSFKAAFGATTASCGACHQGYRIKKN
ncbi:MAG: cytochrome c [Rhizobiaceae bacterium]|nr:cytochrome c [Rhizobiaceae bacterium]